MRRRTLRFLLGAVLAACLCVLVFLILQGSRPYIRSFATCVADNGVLSQEGAVCTTRRGDVLHRDDRVTLDGPVLPFSFAYPGRLDVRVRRVGVTLTGSGESLEVVMLPPTDSTPDNLLRPLTASGAYSVIRSSIDARHEGLLVLPRNKGDSAALLVPLHPPLSHRRRTIGFIRFMGTEALVLQALDSLALE